MNGLTRLLPAAAPWAALFLLLLAGLPLFLCMPVWADATHYDLAARNLLTGGVHYRDVFDNNLPGMVWLHLVVRGLLGWSFPALRLADILVYAAIVALLTRWLTARAWTALALFAFYLSLTEWCHCQRDTWMLLPALAALHLRRRQVTAPPASAGRGILTGLAEGLLWGAAFWIKPFVALPFVACWPVGVVLARRAGRPWVLPTVTVIGGGLIALAAGLAWLAWSGAWPYFCEDCLRWNSDYAAGSLGIAQRTRLLLRGSLLPWGLLHLPATAVAVRALLRRATPPLALLAAFYLGWLVQAAYVQKCFDYNLAPAVPLALAILTAAAPSLWGAPRWRRRIAAAAVAGFVLVVAWRHPLGSAERLALWPRCWRDGGSAGLRDRLRLQRGPDVPDWGDLERVVAYLHRCGAGDGEVTCYNNSTHPIYLSLGVRPSTPFLHCDTMRRLFPSHRAEVLRRIENSGHRFIVIDLQALKPGEEDTFPRGEPVVYRSGRYVVHRVR